MTLTLTASKSVYVSSRLAFASFDREASESVLVRMAERLASSRSMAVRMFLAPTCDHSSTFSLTPPALTSKISTLGSVTATVLMAAFFSSKLGLIRYCGAEAQPARTRIRAVEMVQRALDCAVIPLPHQESAQQPAGSAVPIPLLQRKQQISIR